MITLVEEYYNDHQNYETFNNNHDDKLLSLIKLSFERLCHCCKQQSKNYLQLWYYQMYCKFLILIGDFDTAWNEYYNGMRIVRNPNETKCQYYSVAYFVYKRTIGQYFTNCKEFGRAYTILSSIPQFYFKKYNVGKSIRFIKRQRGRGRRHEQHSHGNSTNGNNNNHGNDHIYQNQRGKWRKKVLK